jgi:hypothetical protein
MAKATSKQTIHLELSQEEGDVLYSLLCVVSSEGPGKHANAVLAALEDEGTADDIYTVRWDDDDQHLIVS